MGRLAGKVAVITGAGSGMGKESAILFAAEGAKVTITDWNQQSLQDTELLIRESGGEVLAVSADVSVAEQVSNVFDRTAERFSRLDVLLNSAGIVGKENSVIDCTEEVFMQVIRVNLVGTWLCMKYAIPAMVESGGGSIINFASIAALEAYKGIPAYAASKGGVIAMSRVAAIESAEKNIRVNTIAPGHIATPMFLGAWTDEQLEHLEEISPQGRLGRPEEIARVALFLASDDSSHVTASLIVADGGITARIP